MHTHTSAHLQTCTYVHTNTCTYTHNTPGNAIKNADTPVMDALAEAEGEYLTLDASGLAVGLPVGLMGNSEVGHFTIGTGQVVYQVRRRWSRVVLFPDVHHVKEVCLAYCVH